MGLHENITTEAVSRLALRDPVVCQAGETIREAVQKMRQQKLGCAIVVDDDRKPVGMFTESMLKRMLVSAPQSVEESLEKHMARQWPWVRASDPIADVLEAMQAKNVRFICVVDEEGRLSALTGQKGLMEYIAEHFPGQVMVQRVGSKPYMHEREGA